MAPARFDPSAGLRGTVTAPPDKSISHRAALLAAMSERPVRIERYLDAADTRSTLGAVEALGAGVELSERLDGGLDLVVSGVGLRGPDAGLATIDVGNAGTLIRLISGWLAAQPGREFTLDGDQSIRARPMGRIAEPLRRMGARIEAGEGDRPPLRIAAAELQGIRYRLPVSSAQVKSCLLLAGLLADGETQVDEPEPTRDHTERMLRASGVPVRTERTTAVASGPPPMRITVAPVERIELPDTTVPGDFSSAAFHLVAGCLVSGSAVRVEGVGLNPTRIGLLGILHRMGAAIEVEESGVEAGEPVGAIDARPVRALRGTRVSGAEIPSVIDELPLVALLGCFAEGKTVVSGAEELRHKESDRIATVCAAIEAIGGEIEPTDDGFIVTGRGRIPGGGVEAAGDHRIAMLGAIAGLASEGGVEVAGIEAAAVSYPGFEADLARLSGA